MDAEYLLLLLVVAVFCSIFCWRKNGPSLLPFYVKRQDLQLVFLDKRLVIKQM